MIVERNAKCPDSFDTRRYMRSIFAPFCSLVEARDGVEALEACKQQLPDLIVTDVMMPNVRAYSALEEYR